MSLRKKEAFIIASFYALFGFIWILVSDTLVFRLFGEVENLFFYSTLKGLIFVMVSGLIFLFVLRKEMDKRFVMGTMLNRSLREKKKNTYLGQTQRRLLLNLIDEAPVPMMLHAENKQILRVSKAFTEATGFTVEEIPTIRAWVERAYPYKRDESYEHITQLYSLDKSLHQGIANVQTKSGETLHWEWDASYIGRDENNLKNIISIARDVTEQKRREKMLTHKSYHDDLTGLYNRRYYNEMTERFESMHDIGIVLADINGLKLINDIFGHSRGDALLQSFAKHLKTRMPKDSLIARLGGDEFVVVVENFERHDMKAIAKQIKHDTEHNGEEIIPSAAIAFSAKKPEEKLKHTIARAENLLYKDKIHEYNKQTESIIASLQNTLFKETDESREHLDRLLAFCEAMIEKMNLEEEMATEMRLLGELHDIGKISVDRELFTKKDELHEDERKEIERHPEIGYRIANALPRLKSVAYAILTHHENYDGSGYPFGLEKKEIPLIARIFRVIESYEVMTRGCFYKPAVSHEEAVATLKDLREKTYDPQIVDAFLESLDNDKKA